jgi:chaperonin GroEL
MSKDVRFGTEAREGLQQGLDVLADAVKATLGPKGRHAAIERAFGPPLITKDGVTVARSITLSDNMQSMGAELVKSVASSTNALAGDGTTTATVLAQSIYTEGAKMVAAGHNPVLIKRGIDKATKVVVDKLKSISKEVSDESVVTNVAIISANNDIELGTTIGQAVSAIGDHGMISVEDAPGFETAVTYTEGMTFDRGYITPTFATNLEKLTVEFENPFILVYDGRISNTYDLMPILEAVSEQGRPLLIISQTTEDEALQTLVLNKARGALSSCAVRAPGFGDIRRDMLGDIAVVCGTTLFTNEVGCPLRDVSLTQLGSARRVVVTRNSTTIIDGVSSQEHVDERISLLNTQLEQSLETYEIASIKQRLSTLSGSVAIFKVGGVSESEVKERKDRVEDAINAVKAAVEEGIVPGGGSALLHCVSDLKKLKNDPNLITEELIGVDVIAKAIRAPFIQILTNAGIEYFSFMEKIITSKKMFSGYDAFNDCYVDDMMKSGIIDPVKVVRSALENAASASGTLLTTEVAIFDSSTENDS